MTMRPSALWTSGSEALLPNNPKLRERISIFFDFSELERAIYIIKLEDRIADLEQIIIELQKRLDIQNDCSES